MTRCSVPDKGTGRVRFPFVTEGNSLFSSAAAFEHSTTHKLYEVSQLCKVLPLVLALHQQKPTLISLFEV